MNQTMMRIIKWTATRLCNRVENEKGPMDYEKGIDAIDKVIGILQRIQRFLKKRQDAEK